VKMIPQFESEQEEAEFWDAHDSADYVDDTEPAEFTFEDARVQKRLISLRIHRDAIDTLRDIASRMRTTR
jgi:hypothetical protein